jgi:MFS family permease
MKTNAPAIASVVGCLIIQICVGILYLWSVFKTPIVDSFNWSIEAATMVSSYMLFAFVTGNLIGGFLNDRKGPRRRTSSVSSCFPSASASPPSDEKTIGWMNLTYMSGQPRTGFA